MKLVSHKQSNCRCYRFIPISGAGKRISSYIGDIGIYYRHITESLANEPIDGCYVKPAQPNRYAQYRITGASLYDNNIFDISSGQGTVKRNDTTLFDFGASVTHTFFGLAVDTNGDIYGGDASWTGHTVGNITLVKRAATNGSAGSPSINIPESLDPLPTGIAFDTIHPGFLVLQIQQLLRRTRCVTQLQLVQQLKLKILVLQ